MKLRVRNTKATAVPWVCGLIILLSSAKAEGPAPEFSAPLSQEALFARCYRLLTKLELGPDHPLLVQVQNSEKSASDACMEIFDQATLTLSSQTEASGARSMSLTSFDDELKQNEARAVLATFEEHFVSWFSTRDFATVPDSNTNGRGLKETLDSTEESLHLLRALFGRSSTGQRFSFNQIVLSADSLQSVRTHPTRTTVLPASINAIKDSPQITLNENTTESFQGFKLLSQNENYSVTQHTAGAASATLNKNWKGETVNRVGAQLIRVNCTQGYLNDCYNDIPEWGALQEPGGPSFSTTPGQGELLGLRVFDAGYPNHYFSRNGRPISQLTMKFLTGIHQNVESPRSNAGGILGLRSFLSKNIQSQTFANGGSVAKRRISKEFFEALLCREAPLIRSTDGAIFVDGGELGSSPPQMITGSNKREPPFTDQEKELIPFRLNSTCMSCHAPLDGGAAVFRNYQVAEVNSFNLDDDPLGVNDKTLIGRFVPPVAAYTPDPQALHLKADQPPSTGTPLNPLRWNAFSKSSPSGLLVYRNFRGDLIYQELDPTTVSDDPTPENSADNGVAALGRALAQQDDLYVCAAARLVEHFTGIQADLSDPEGDSRPEWSTEEKKVRQWVEQLGLELKESQDLRGVVHSILKSGQFKNHGFTTSGGSP